MAEEGPERAGAAAPPPTGRAGTEGGEARVGTRGAGRAGRSPRAPRVPHLGGRAAALGGFGPVRAQVRARQLVPLCLGTTPGALRASGEPRPQHQEVLRARPRPPAPSRFSPRRAAPAPPSSDWEQAGHTPAFSGDRDCWASTCSLEPRHPNLLREDACESPNNSSMVPRCPSTPPPPLYAPGDPHRGHTSRSSVPGGRR